MRGINHAVVAALGGVPRTHHATLVPRALDAIANEHAERGRTPILAIDEAHLLQPHQLEAVRMLTSCRVGGYSGLAALAFARVVIFGDLDHLQRSPPGR